MNIFLSALIITVIFGLLKFFECNFVLKIKEGKFKILFRDSLMCYIAAIAGIWVNNQFSATEFVTHVPVFTDNPGF